VLVDAWGNPPESAEDVLGMIFPAEIGPAQENGWGVVVTYEKDGYVSDEGAEKIDYTKMLREMQESAARVNRERKAHGFPSVEIVGWAEAPRYDRASHKLYWAKDVRFDGRDPDTLNYNTRVLGRRGVLVLNAVSGMDQLATVKSEMERLLPRVEFNEGHRYADFVPGKDKVAEYGLVALIAGGAALAAKGGLLKWLVGGLLALKKFAIVGVAALAAGFRRLFSGRSKPPEDPIEPT
jgi:uncharacterized membrane-anchored protein